MTIHRAPQHPPVVIVRQGVPRAKVYLAEERPSKNLAILLKELVEVVRLSTGAELEVVRRMPAADVSAIVIGDCSAARAAGIDAAAIPVEGYVVKTAPGRVFLVGSTAPLPTVTNISDPYGNDATAWAVADFLERFVGVRWYWPSETGGRSIVRNATLQVGPVHYSDQPVFRKRNHWPPRYSKKNGEWRARWFEKKDPTPAETAIPPGVDTIDMVPLLATLRMGNSWPYMIKVHQPQAMERNARFVEQHKAMFAKKKDGTPNAGMLCYTSPEAFDFLMAGCERFWTKGQKVDSWVTDTAVTISPGDEPVNCCCELPEALRPARGYLRQRLQADGPVRQAVRRRSQGPLAGKDGDLSALLELHHVPRGRGVPRQRRDPDVYHALRVDARGGAGCALRAELCGLAEEIAR